MGANQPDPRPLPTALLIPGQGAQYPRMAVGLYGRFAAFSRRMDEAFELMGEQGPSVRAEWLAERPSASFDDVAVAQPLLYAVGYALGQLFIDQFGPPDALLGHSAGEFVSAALAGIFDFADGMRLVMERIPDLASTQPGGMLAVAASLSEVEPFLDEDLHLAAVNDLRQVLLSGTVDSLTRAATRLGAAGLTWSPVAARQAFHSPLVAGASVRAGRDWTTNVTLKPPLITLYSAYIAGPLTPETACDPSFWIEQPARTVFFAAALDRLLSDGDHLLVETGPGQTLSTLARRHPRVRSGRSEVLAMLPGRPRAADGEAERAALRSAAARVMAHRGSSTSRLSPSAP
jgi:acyl transferase domain-containing protein